MQHASGKLNVNVREVRSEGSAPFRETLWGTRGADKCGEECSIQTRSHRSGPSAKPSYRVATSVVRRSLVAGGSNYLASMRRRVMPPEMPISPWTAVAEGDDDFWIEDHVRRTRKRFLCAFIHGCATRARPAPLRVPGSMLGPSPVALSACSRECVRATEP